MDSSTRSRTSVQPGAKCLSEQMPLQPAPTLNCKNLNHLGEAKHVNIVFERSRSNAFFRISDHDNQDVCLITHRKQQNGIKYLECHDLKQNCVLYIAYPIGLGTVAILSPQEELLGECQSNVQFVCLSVKVKYNFYDATGQRILKMCALIPENNEDSKFRLMVRGQKKEKLALIEMGSLKSCCHVKFKSSQVSILQRLQIISLWAGFMYNELEDSEAPLLIERRDSQLRRDKELRKSRRKSRFSIKMLKKTDSMINVDRQSSSNKEMRTAESQCRKESNDNMNCDKPMRLVKTNPWKKLVPQLSRSDHGYKHPNFNESTNNNSTLTVK